MKIIKGGVTAPEGFLAGATSCGIKKSGKTDLALLFSETPCVAVGTFTTNKVKSGSVVLCMERLKKGKSQGVIVNSGNANCCSGKKEIKDAMEITEALSSRLGVKKGLMLMASTGIIGRPLPVEKIKNGLDRLLDGLSANNGTNFAKAIMTTDTVHKDVAIRVDIKGRTIKLAGAVKGSGMICPNMATMLAFFTTDALIEKSALKSSFKQAISESFNKITVDGDMSTNDSAFILANGLAKNKIIKKDTLDYPIFLKALKFVAGELARKIVLDGEGATRFVEIIVKNAKNEGVAEKIARHIATSSLVKTMIAGGDPNWGRIAASAGSSRADINKDKLDIYFGKILVMKNGVGRSVPRDLLSGVFKKKEIEITVDLKSGNKDSKIWTCDLTEEYVKINAEYET
jgi:glutamate N-acetyltransferase/amino-acid N-acetyltransferase